jgi:UDP-3-O-[3-hydroxymyristoyl] glucosamine N-acyltransferase
MTGHTTGSLATLLNAELLGPPGIAIERLDTLDRGGPGILTFIRSSAFAADWATSKAVAALVSRGLAVPGHDPAARALLVVEDADLALAKTLEVFAPRPWRPSPGIHPSAAVDPTAKIGQIVAIGPCCTVGPGAMLGDGVVLMSNISIGAGASVGRGTVLHPGVVIGERCTVGQGCIFYGGAVIGADGFGYRPAPDGRGVVKIPHIGTVEVGDGVEIGANSCVDRGKFGATVIGSGTKIDNLVQIGHNCRIGRACLICGMCGIAGSVTIGDGVVVGGLVGISDNLTIGAGAKIGAKSGVINDVPAGETWWGFPAQDAREAARNYAAIRGLTDLQRRVKKLERAVGDEAGGGGAGG